RTRLQPFDYWDAAALLGQPPAREAAVLYGVFGGTPRYLAAARQHASVADAVQRLMLAPGGEVHIQVEQIIEQEKGIRTAAEYRAMLTAIAAGHTTTAAMASATGLEQTSEVGRRLPTLVNLGLVRGEQNFGAPAKAPYRY